MSSEELPPLLIESKDETELPIQKKIPVTLLTGFLGSGKTTFLNYILTQNHGKKIAVIQNEFGEELGIERAMIMGKKDDRVQEWLELPNGCICCTVRDELVLALEALIEKKDRFDYIFIETTGMADPGPLATSLWLDEDLGSSLFLDAIITIVDSKNLLHHLSKEETSPDTYNEAQKQIAFADLLILNKTDLVTEEEIKVIIDKVTSINVFAPYILTKMSVVQLDKVLDIRAFDPNRLDLTLKKLNVDHDDHHHPVEENEVKAFTIKVEGECKSKSDLEEWLGNLMWEKSLDIYRVKGEVALMDDEYRYIIQGVHDNFEISRTDFKWDEKLPTPTSTSENNEYHENKRINQLVFIGKNLPFKEIEETFKNNVLVTR